MNTFCSLNHRMKTLAFLPELQIKASGFRMPFSISLFSTLSIFLNRHHDPALAAFSPDTGKYRLAFSAENDFLPFPHKTIRLFHMDSIHKDQPGRRRFCRFAPRYGKSPPDTRLSSRREATLSTISRGAFSSQIKSPAGISESSRTALPALP